MKSLTESLTEVFVSEGKWSKYDNMSVKKLALRYNQITSSIESDLKHHDELLYIEKILLVKDPDTTLTENINEAKNHGFKVKETIGYHGREGVIKLFAHGDAIVYFADVDGEEAIDLKELAAQNA